MVHEAVAFWSKTLDEAGSGFRIGAGTRVNQAIPEADGYIRSKTAAMPWPPPMHIVTRA